MRGASFELVLKQIICEKAAVRLLFLGRLSYENVKSNYLLNFGFSISIMKEIFLIGGCQLALSF